MRVVQIGSNGEVLMWSDMIEPDGISFFQCPNDYSASKYSYTPLPGGGFNSDGFVLIQVQEDAVNFAKRSENIQRMNTYMAGQVNQSTLDVFLSDTATHVQGYLNGGSRLITWIETINRNGYNATTAGFKTKGTYRGSTTNGIDGKDGNYPRANYILEILNDL